MSSFDENTKLRAAFDAATAALLASKDETVSVSRGDLCALLDYVGIREFTFAARAKKRPEGTGA